MVEHSPQILASEEKATTTTTSNDGQRKLMAVMTNRKTKGEAEQKRGMMAGSGGGDRAWRKTGKVEKSAGTEVDAKNKQTKNKTKQTNKQTKPGFVEVTKASL